MGAAISIQTWRLDRAERAAGRSALEADTLRAAADSSRTLGVIVSRLGDSLTVVGRQVVQVGQRGDSIDRVLKVTRIARDCLTVRVRTLEATTTGTPTTETPAGVRSGSFTVDEPPYHVTANVTLPPPPAPGTISLAVRLDSIPLEVRHGCTDDANAAGIRSAFVTVVGPSWAPVAVRRVEQDPGLCRSPALEPAHGDGRNLFRKLLDRVGVSAGLGITAGTDLTSGRPAVAAGPSVLVGVKLWP